MNINGIEVRFDDYHLREIQIANRLIHETNDLDSRIYYAKRIKLIAEKLIEDYEREKKR